MAATGNATTSSSPLNNTADLSSLLPAYQQQYLSLAPSIQLAIQQQENAQGMGNSGQADTATAQGLASLLGSLSSQSANAQTQQQLQAQQEQAQAQLQSQQIAAQKQANTSGMISSGLGAGLGALGTLGMLKYMKGGPSSGGALYQMGANGQIYNTQTGQLAAAAGGGAPSGAAGAAAGASDGSVADPIYQALTGSAPGAAAAGAPVAAASASAAPTAGWQQLVSKLSDPTTAAEAAGAGALGGLAGNQLGGMAFGGKNSTIGSAVGGLGGALTGLGLSDGSPWGALLGGALGSFGGGGLGGLFK